MSFNQRILLKTECEDLLRQAKLEFDTVPNVAICDFGDFKIVTTDKEQMGIDMRMYRRVVREGRVQIMPENNVMRLDMDNRNWYHLVLQSTSQPDSPSAAALAFGRHVSGITYLFSSEDNRDKVYRYIMSVCCFLPTDARLLRTHTLVCVPLLSH
jgi:hypothetical protein